MEERLDISSIRSRCMLVSFAKKEVFIVWFVDNLIYYSTVFAGMVMLFSI